MKKFLSIVIAVMMMCVLPFTSSVQAAEAGADTLMVLKELGIMEGDSYGNLNLENNVTRAEFTKMAVKASKYRNSVALNLNISPYKDVTFKMWYAPYVKTASENALVKGYSDGSFKPDNTVLYEEAVTILLRLLGYTDEDFGVSWPYGQMGIAESIGLCDDVACSIGMEMKRNEVAVLFGNFLRTYMKGTANEYITSIDYSIIDDVILVATANEDTTVGSGKIFTSAGTFKINSYFDYSIVGKRGTAVLKNNNELVLFAPDQQIVNEYTVYQVLNNNVVVMENGTLVSIDIANDLTVYNKSSKTSLQALSSQLSVGDGIVTYSNTNGVIDYGIVKTNELKGPYTVANENWMITYNLSNPTINKNGVKTDAYSVETYDIIYYSQKLNTVWAYSDKITGVYEKAIPNKDNPTSVQVSGVTYTIEGLSAFSKLSTGGQFGLGDTVTLLMGKDGKVADVKTTSINDSSLYGYLSETGTKTFEDSTGAYSSYYITVVKANGETATYATKNNYKDSKNKIVSVSFSGKYASISTLNTTTGISGLFLADSLKIGKTPFSENVSILEVSTNEVNKTGVYKSAYPSRLDGVNLKSSQVMYAKKNAKGVITELFLKDVTGDLHKYGIVTQAPSSKSQGGGYSVDINGSNFSVGGSKTYIVSEGQPCKVVYNGNSIDTLLPLTKINSLVNSISGTVCKAGGTEYLVSPDAAVYVRKADYSYMIISMNELNENFDMYSVSAYYDSSVSLGGRVRVFVANPRTY